MKPRAGSTDRDARHKKVSSGSPSGKPRATIAAAMEILMLVASESGNAEMVGDCVKDAFEAEGHTVELNVRGDIEVDRLAEAKMLLVCSSTTGLGDIPQNGAKVFDRLQQQRPNLSAVYYAVVGLGDRSYKETFLGGPRKWDAIFEELGAKRLLPMLALDATDHPMPDQDAVEWLPTLLDAARAQGLT